VLLSVKLALALMGGSEEKIKKTFLGRGIYRKLLLEEGC
jgi:hypothetical protein